MTTRDYQPFVKAGAALLDAKKPAWATVIDRYALYIGSACNCILGQVYGDYGAGLTGVDLSDDEWEYGFYPHPDDIYDNDSYHAVMATMKSLWIAEIDARTKGPRTEAS